MNAAVLTAMKPDLSPDLDRMGAHARWLLANGCNGLGVLGTTGEANSFGLHERKAILEGLIACGVPAGVMMPGTGCASLTDTVELTLHAKAQGCRGVLVLPPFYYKGPSDDGLFAYFSEVINRVGGGIAIYLYHFPQQSAVPFSLDLIGRLLKAYPGAVKGVKDSSGDYANMLAMVDHFAGTASRSIRARTNSCSDPGGWRRRLHHRGEQRQQPLGRHRLCQAHRPGSRCGPGHAGGDPPRRHLGAADPRPARSDRPQPRRRQLAHHPPAAPEARPPTGRRDLGRLAGGRRAAAAGPFAAVSRAARYEDGGSSRAPTLRPAASIGRPAALPGTGDGTTQLDDEHVRVTRWDFNPGAETGWHRHGWLYVVVPVTDGTLLLELPGGQTVTAN